MAVQFKVPAPPKRSVETIDVFHGADFTNSPAAISIDKSPNCKNMIRSAPGKVRKSMGWQTVKTVADSPAVNGFFEWSSIDTSALYKTDVYHVGTKLFKGEWDDANKEFHTWTEINPVPTKGSISNARSHSWEQDKLLFIIDGTTYLAVRNTGVALEYFAVDKYEGAYIPTVTISKEPNGGGTPYEDLNLVQSGFIEQFLGTAGTVEYQLSFTNLDASSGNYKKVKAEILQSDGTWETVWEGSGLTVNRETGVVTFANAPGASPIAGEDNVKITAYRTVSGYASRINKCTIGITYGGIGGKERLFLSGNPDYPNYDWYSEPYDYTYFKDTSYSRLGNDASDIMGYAVIANKLVTFKDEKDREQNAIVRTPSTDSDNKEIFVITNALQGIGVVAKESFGYLAHEPLFLTSQGVYSITTQDITGEKYMQLRSFFLNGKLLKEADLSKAVAFCYNNYYILAINGVFYILDGLQALQTDKSAPYSTRQYVGFYRTNVPARVVWENEGALWFGTADGKIRRFHTDEKNQKSYNDDNELIECVWETPDIDGELFYKNKTLRYLATRVEAAIATSVKIYGMERGLWNLIKVDTTFARYFSYANVVYSKFTYSCNKTQKTSRTKARIKKVDKFRLRFVNDAVNEPFSLFNIGMEYVEKGYFKG